MAKKAKSIPEVIYLSDDEDDDHNISKSIVTPVRQPSTTISNGEKRPEISSTWTVHRKDIIRVPDSTIKSNDLIKNPLELSCSTVRFGILEFNVEDEIILLKETEFELKLKSDLMNNLNIKLAYSDIISFYFSYQCQQPIAFIQVRAEFAELFAKYIPSIDEHGKQFDPNSKDVKRCRIILLLKSLKPDVEKQQISSIYYYLKTLAPTLNICCLNGSRAQEFYNLSRFAKISALDSTTSSFTIDENDLKSKTVSLHNNTIRFDLSHDDLLCLNEGEFLNDNIIDFYLQYVYYEKLSEEDRQRTYLFNSFFYTRLTRKGNDDIPDVSPAERRYNRVKRWLRDVDIFSKDYLIVPINQTAHWYIVIIRYHNNVLTEGDLISDDEDNHDQRLKSKKKKTTSHSTVNNSKKPSETAIEIVDEADEVLVDDKDESEKSILPKNPSQKPTIIMFDSLRAGPKNRVAATLREFLQLEYDHKKALPVGSLGRKIFNLDTIPAVEAAVPQQPNYFDCGLYILQYIESFFAYRSPTIDYQSPSTYANWCEKTSMGSSKRKQIFNTINQHVISREE